MKRLNAKKIAAVVSGAALLGFGLAFASPIIYQSVPIIVIGIYTAIRIFYIIFKSFRLI